MSETFRMQGPTAAQLKAEWDAVKARVAAENAQSKPYAITPLTSNPSPLQVKWFKAQAAAGKALGLTGPASPGSLSGADAEQEDTE